MRDRDAIAKIESQKKEELAQIAKERRKEEARNIQEKLLASDPEFKLPVEPPRQRHTLGTMDPKDNYRLLVTLDNQGATIERIELVSQTKPGRFDYRSLQSKNIVGYLGYLALDESVGPLRINSVPKGSAAALAKCKDDPNLTGLLVNDRIVGWEDLTDSPSYYKLTKLLASKKPGDTVTLEIERDAPASENQPVPETKPASDQNNTAEPNDKSAVAEVTAIPAPTKLTFIATLTEKPVEILRAEDDFDAEQVLGNFPHGSCATTLSTIDQTQLEDGEQFIVGLEKTIAGRWQSKEIPVENGMGVEFTMPIEGLLKLAGVKAKLELVKQYRLLPSKSDEGTADAESRQYHLELTTIVRNLDDAKHSVAIRQEGLNGISLEGWWYPTKLSPFFFNAAGARDVISGDGFASYSIQTTRSIVSNAVSYPANPDVVLFGPQDNAAKRSVNYMGLDTQVFTAAMLPSPSAPDSMKELSRAKATVLNSAYKDSAKLPAARQQACNTGFWFETQTQEIAPKGEIKHAYRIFSGPKDAELLAAYKLDDAIEYGWPIFGFFAKRLGWILHLFFWITGNFGIAIMMLTVLVRSCMFPVSRKMALNAQKMQAVQPALAKLRESLKEDPRKMMVAQQLLMKKAGINQFAGCLPALIQLPIVIGLYRCVSVDVGLRQQALVPGWEWCSNLAGPDMWLDWHSWMPEFFAGRGTGWFGPYLNILPIITIALFIIQQRVLMPKATDDQTRVAQQMMMVMTVMMGVLFFKVPAGLCIYFITSSTWSLVERFLIKRFTPKASIKELPPDTANEILATLAKGPVQPQRASANNTSNSDRPKLKATKPPETLADLFPGWFGKKIENPNPNDSKDSSGGDSRSNDRNNRGPKRPKRPKK